MNNKKELVMPQRGYYSSKAENKLTCWFVWSWKNEMKENWKFDEWSELFFVFIAGYWFRFRCGALIDLFINSQINFIHHFTAIISSNFQFAERSACLFFSSIQQTIQFERAGDWDWIVVGYGWGPALCAAASFASPFRFILSIAQQIQYFHLSAFIPEDI